MTTSVVGVTTVILVNAAVLTRRHEPVSTSSAQQGQLGTAHPVKAKQDAGRQPLLVCDNKMSPKHRPNDFVLTGCPYFIIIIIEWASCLRTHMWCSHGRTSQNVTHIAHSHKCYFCFITGGVWLSCSRWPMSNTLNQKWCLHVSAATPSPAAAAAHKTTARALQLLLELRLPSRTTRAAGSSTAACIARVQPAGTHGSAAHAAVAAAAQSPGTPDLQCCCAPCRRALTRQTAAPPSHHSVMAATVVHPPVQGQQVVAARSLPNAAAVVHKPGGPLQQPQRRHCAAPASQCSAPAAALQPAPAAGLSHWHAVPLGWLLRGSCQASAQGQC
ncbi:hypothetical protein COO60DRAFT_1472488 [Scenedesmus sp. NREL 46B-D3]|nr:hypothetical protein COO60DRAFT_1472488 [Scenedesmus sp. NREL 46B-D3]